MWVSLFVLLLFSVMPPRSRYRRAAGYPGRDSVVPWEDSQERSDKIDRKMEVLLVEGWRCFSQAYCQAERMIDNKKWLRKFGLNKIQAECEDECCDPCAYEMHWYEAQKLEYERERLPKHYKKEERRRVPFENYHEPQECPGSSRSATSSAILGSVNTSIPKAATEHSEIRRLLNLADENSKSSEAATEHSEIPEAACQEAKRPRKSGKGSFSQTQKMLCPGTNAKTTTQACEH